MFRVNKPKRQFPFSNLVTIGIALYLLANRGFYMSLGMLWYDVTNIFNDNYDRQSLGFVISSRDPDPIFAVMGVVSSIGFIMLIVGLAGLVVSRYLQNRS